MEQSSGQMVAKLAKPADGGEDRLSALPDELLVLILQCLGTTAEAAQTSVLARRWRNLWPLLSRLYFKLSPDSDRMRELLDVTDAPELCYISIFTKGAIADSVTVWLPVVARRLTGGLFYHDSSPENYDKEVEMARRGGTVNLPCFENATSIWLHLRHLGLALPSLGVFTRLTDLYLRSVEFRGSCALGDLVSSPRCPCLRNLNIDYPGGLSNLSIHSESLLQINLTFCKLRLQQLTIATPLLQKLCVEDSFLPAIAARDDQSEQQGANIIAPQIVSLVWMDRYDSRYFHLGNLGELRKLQTGRLYVYGQQANREYNRSCLRLLQQFKVLGSLHLRLNYTCYKQDDGYDQYLLGDMAALPRITFLQLDLYNYEHAFGASMFHVLRMCIGLRSLSLVLYGRPSKTWRQNLLHCPLGCVCDQPENWKTDELMLDHLEEVSIIGLRGAKHEVAFLQRFLCWATILKSLRITLVNETTEAKIGEFREALAGSLRPETCAQFDTCDDK